MFGPISISSNNLSNISGRQLEDWISSTFGTEMHDHSEEEGEFYSSLVVMVATGVWCYVLSLYVNAAKPEEGTKHSEKDPGKEL